MSGQRLSERMRRHWPPDDLVGAGWVEGEEDRVHSWADEVAALEAKLEAMERALGALIIKTQSGQICFRTNHNIPMGMSRKQERLVAAAQEEQK